MSGAPGSERERIFVGDVHGCADELEDLLDALAFDPTHHELWFVGDLVNRGPASLRALRRVREIAAGSVLGNHDLHAIARWNGARRERPRDTLEALLEAPDARELMDWLRARPVFVTWDDLVLVHAGLHPAWTDPDEVERRIRTKADWDNDPLEDPELAFATTVRECDERGRRPPRGGKRRGNGKRFKPWDAFYEGDRTVVFGHWAQRGRVRGRRVRGLDTGCVWGGELTAWRSGRDEFVSVPARAQYQEIESDSE